MLNILNIVRDCYWALPSGTSQLYDEDNNVASHVHGLYNKLNTNDSQYITADNSGEIRYYGRLSSDNLQITHVYTTLRASVDPPGSAVLSINNLEMGSIAVSGGINDYEASFLLNNAQKQQIHEGRILKNYDYFDIKLGSDGASSPVNKLYDLSIAFSGDSDWDNHTTGLPTVLSDTYYPTVAQFTGGIGYTGSVDDINDGAGAAGVDNTYIVNNGTEAYLSPWADSALMPSGYLSLKFGDFPSGVLDAGTDIKRARLNLRMSLPLASGDNKRDVFEVNGFNARYRDGDDRSELNDDSSQLPLEEKEGYFLYGAGDVVETSGFQNYYTELNFLNPFLPSGDISSTRYANSDMLTDMDFRVIGLPSGTQISAAELLVEYLTDTSLQLYIVGDLERQDYSEEIDTTYSTGHGGWHHQGWRSYGPNAIEEDVFTNFYTFSETATNRTYPETANAHYYTGNKNASVYGTYVVKCPTSIGGSFTSRIPQKREYYRNPISARDLTPAYESRLRDISSYKPHYYRHMIYHGASLDYVDVEFGDGDATSLAEDDLCQIYFDDRLSLTEDFTLYFAIYRDYGFQTYGRFFHRGMLEGNGIDNYEILGDLQLDSVRFTIKGANDTDNVVEVEINPYTKEPILIWFNCEYNQATGKTTITLNVHHDTKNYFSTNWLRSQTTFTGRRRQYTGVTPRTAIGTLEDLDVYEHIARHLYLHRASPVEFGYANESIDLNYATGTSTITQSTYATSSDKDKHFLSTRVSNSQYLQPNPSGVRWIVPHGSGAATWSTTYSTSFSDTNVNSIYNPISLAGNTNIIHPSAIWVEMELAHSTNHPYGLNVDVDIGFNADGISNWKMARASFNNLPSGGALWSSYSPITYTTGISKHINMNDGPILTSDVDDINVELTTSYVDDGTTQYDGSAEIRKLTIHFDAYYDAPDSTSQLDLYTIGKSIDSSGNITLYTIAESGSVPLPGGVDTTTSLHLFIDGLDPPEASGFQNLFVWGTEDPTLWKSTTLYIKSTLDPDYMLPLYLDGGVAEIITNMPLFLGNYVPSVNNLPSGLSMYTSGPDSSTNSMTLYINTPSGTEDAFVERGRMNLYIARDSEAVAGRLGLYLENKHVPGILNTFIEGTILTPSSIPLYISGSGAPPSNNLKLYTHGF